MKIKLSDIKLGFKSKLFDILIDDIPDRGIIYKNNLIHCDISAVKINENCFNLLGKIDATLEYECVRCLNPYHSTISIPIDISLNNQSNLNQTKYNKEIIDIRLIENELNLGAYISDLIALSKPIKSLCNDKCKGICYICGINKNSLSCDCKDDKDLEAWAKLKRLEIKKN